MSPRVKRRRRRHQLQQQKQPPGQNPEPAELDGAALTQPIFLVLSKEEVTVYRSMPTILSGRMDDSSWNSFCDELDDALLPITNMKNAMKTWCFYPLALFFPLIVVGLVTTAVVATRSLNESSSGETSEKMLPMLFLIAFVVAVLWAMGMTSYSSRCKRKVDEEIERICYETWPIYSGISFKAYIEMRYVQVIVSNDTVDALEKDDSYSTASNSSSSSGSLHSRTSALTPASLAEAKKWRTAIDENTNKIYYFNEETMAVSWEYPLEFDEVNDEDENEANAKSFIDGCQDGIRIVDVEPEVGIETSISFDQVHVIWETPLESDEGNEEEESEANVNELRIDV